MTFRQTFIRVLSRNLFSLLCFAGTFAAFSMFAPSDMSYGDNHVERPAAVGSLEDVLSKNECLPTGEGVFPTGAIVREVGAGYSFTKDSAMISKGLDEIFADKEWKRFDVIHFCR